ncbi:glycerophosphodiester phosphodiesterase [Wenjunlia tyrosinilytica]|uniref:glycerophosphodiester phosphodiesterase n=1 Tax=Wenjunlia tyrosinilytica TaxID=1544741 RepID=A0A918DSX9_9ACTN|nr:glycerophosphodiester phosphodiesterase [Wenjunlia tyrosinilytica]GGO82632.1 glycerophosphoryl diester phosphodiesterase [Wenjunlia tyrosinilytica]
MTQAGAPQGERDGKRGPGRRTVLGAGAVGAGSAVLGLSGTARAASGGASGEDASEGDASQRDHGRNRLPVPAVIGHRGASGYRPEHTFGSYELAAELGADVVEQDLVPTKDGHLVCRHENDITGTTDVSEHREFADRRTTKTVDGVSITGWFTEDFTLAELKTLRAKERIPAVRQRNTLYDGRWAVPTFEEVLRWAAGRRAKSGRPLWLHVETKHPSYFRKLGLGLEEPLARLLRAHGKGRRNSPVFLQSFEPSSLQRLGRLVGNPRIQLLSGPTSRPWDFTEAGDPRTVADLVTPEGLAWIAGFAQGIGPTTELIVPTDPATGKLGKPTTLVRDAHNEGLVLHPYTLRNENQFLPADFRKGTVPTDYGNSFGAFKLYFELGIDGVFSDNPDTAVLARADLR